ncbi:cyclin-A2-1 [Cynara cardunculus var. scolymus]|uniref:cyclin-A2-1 n=1 Tax=Cynara cardunculus var. scolymus TaxID=59895 RepID=UPI000D6296D3|nr:cyclin-A2-1 [Cynara cardunculus var. scolymus]
MTRGTTVGESSFRVTRARAAVYQSLVGSEVQKEQGQGGVLRKNPKRGVQDEKKNNANTTKAGGQNKRRAVLKDVTNICCDNSYKNCITAAKIPKKNSKMGKKNSVNMSKVAASVTVKRQKVSAHSQTKKSDETEGTQTRPSAIQKAPDFAERERHVNSSPIEKRASSQLQSFSKKGSSNIHEKLMITDIDSDQKDPQMCSLYASEIYNNLRAAELMRRPRSDFMETVQRDVTQSMRGVLVDWLVEVCEEYKMVPDTLYLTVYLIDLFLSQHYIEQQKLQLLGITCMLIASKYEEICSPSVEEFCFITDSTYTKSEVLKMESLVLNYLNFQLSAPTAKTFLRRFLRAAQASHQIPNLELEFLTNYLVELTLIDYNFLVFVPSTVAASAVFLARWMLNQSCHPWNDTLEYYTWYKPLDLKNTVFALYSLKSSDSRSPLNAIRSKYKQDKFKGVASLPSPEVPETLFYYSRP